MASTPQPIPLMSKPGIKRDGTSFEGDYYGDGLWCRFTARGLPKKMGGYQAVNSHLPEIVRGLDLFTINRINYLHAGGANTLTQVRVAFDGSSGSQYDRTPSLADGFVASDDNLWQLAAFYDEVNGNTSIVAHPGQNLNDISSDIETKIYYGDVSANTPLIDSAMDPVSGGILALPPFIVAFGNSGRIDISKINDLSQATAASAFVTSQKIVKGLPLRGSVPAGIFWSLDALVLMTFDSSILTGLPFRFNEVTTSTSILSSQGVIESDSVYYWPGVDRFLMFSGVIRELPNNMNIDFFYENLNFDHSQKVFAFKVPRWGEIWWCFPKGDSTECNHAVIYNTRLNTWYDTPLPDGGRSAAMFARVHRRPFMCDVDSTPTGFTLWQHEMGLDKVIGTRRLPIRSHYQTHELSPVVLSQGINKSFRVGLVEADFAQTGDLTCTVLGRANARCDQTELETVTIPKSPADASGQITNLKSGARLLSFRFASNTPGGDYTAGRVIAHIDLAEGRITQ